MKQLALCAMFLMAAGSAAPAVAHHSTAMFDAKKTLVLRGTVKEFQWTNPHSWLQVLVPNDKGSVDEWSLELGPNVGLQRAGWRPRSLPPGEKVEVRINPMRDGSNGGSLISVTLSDGKVFNARGGGPDSPADSSATGNRAGP